VIPYVPAAYVSLSQLQDGHAALVKLVGRNLLAPANVDLITRFVHAGIKTGEVLDSPADRAAAQSLITFWTTRLRTAVRDLGKDRGLARALDFEDTLLAEFNPAALLVAAVEPAET